MQTFAMHSASWKKYLAIPTVGLVFVLAAAPKPRAQARKAYEDRSTAKIAAENLLPGTDEDRIEFRNSATAGEVEAYGSALSVWPGEILTIFARSSTGEDMQARVFAWRQIKAAFIFALEHHAVCADVEIAAVRIAGDNAVGGAGITAAIERPVARNRQLGQVDLVAG